MRPKRELKFFAMVVIVAIAIVAVGATAVLKHMNQRFEINRANDLFRGVSGGSVSALADSVGSSMTDFEYFVFTSDTTDSVFISRFFAIHSGNLLFNCRADSQAGSDTTNTAIYFGTWRGHGYGDSLGFEWNLVTTFGTPTGKIEARLTDSTWLGDKETPFGAVKIVETGGQQSNNYSFNSINFKGDKN